MTVTIPGVQNSVEINRNVHTFAPLGCAHDYYYLHFTQTKVKKIFILWPTLFTIFIRKSSIGRRRLCMRGR